MSETDAEYEQWRKTREVFVPGWATSVTVAELADGRWSATFTGDAYGVGSQTTTTEIGTTPTEAAGRAADVAEGWKRFTLVPRNVVPDDLRAMATGGEE